MLYFLQRGRWIELIKSVQGTGHVLLEVLPEEGIMQT